MKNTLGKIIILVIVLTAGYWIVSGFISGRRAERERQAAKQAAKAEEQKVQAEELLKIKKSVQDMVTKHNAVTDWQGSLETDGIEPTFTIEFQDTLIRKDNRPLVFVAAVEDIVREHMIYLPIQSSLSLYCSSTLNKAKTGRWSETFLALFKSLPV